MELNSKCLFMIEFEQYLKHNIVVITDVGIFQ